MPNSTDVGALNRYSRHVSTFALVFVVLWLLGTISSFTMGGLLHVFLIVAIVMMLPRVIQGRKASKY